MDGFTPVGLGGLGILDFADELERKVDRPSCGGGVRRARRSKADSPSGRVCFEVAGSPGDAAIVNLTPVEASGPGFGLLVSSNVANPPVASNVNFTGPASVDPNVAVGVIGDDGEVCFVNSDLSSVDLVADHLGTIDGDAYTPARADGTPNRKVDTRVGVGGDQMGPSGRVCFEVAGSPGDAAIVNLTPVEASGPGFGLLVSSNVANPPVASNVNFTGPASLIRMWRSV